MVDVATQSLRTTDYWRARWRWNGSRRGGGGGVRVTSTGRRLSRDAAHRSVAVAASSVSSLRDPGTALRRA